MPEQPQTIGGAMRAHLLDELEGLSVFRGFAPEGTTTPTVVIHDGIAVNTRELGMGTWVLSETVQVDLYDEVGGSVSLPDQVHAALHGAVLSVDGIQVFRCAVLSRAQDPTDEGDEDGVTRTTFSVNVVRSAAA